MKWLERLTWFFCFHSATIVVEEQQQENKIEFRTTCLDCCLKRVETRWLFTTEAMKHD